MVYRPDHELVDTARRQAGLSLEGLWIRYFELGGVASHLELDAFLTGALVPTPFQRDILVHAINEAFMDKGRPDRLGYLADDTQPGDAYHRPLKGLKPWGPIQRSEDEKYLYQL